ncbi:MAG TPA: cyclic nucleotide-binding domain-containing protein [Solirubrobacteraceae bacterium]|nr:cyclic nucleotide-binding domain-containing protein [Solirubrobacteraceae bacterium]
MRRKSIGSDGAARLQAIELLADLSNAERQALARMIDEVNAEPGEELMHEGDYGYEVVFVEEGTAEVRQGGVAINTVGAGDALGELAVLDTGGMRTATVVATTPLRGIVLTSHFLHHVRQQMPTLAAAIDRAAEAHRERDRARQAGQPAD